MKQIHLIAAARPNFMKIAPLYHALKKEAWAEPIIVHTGQHYDATMSDAFFKDLELPDPDYHLGIGSGSHAEQTGGVMIAYEKLLNETRPDMIVVVGDVNSTVACTLAAVKIAYLADSSKLKAHSNNKNPTNNYELSATSYELGRPLVAHLEAGLRSFDRTMPEEINRIVTDSIADLLWTPSPDGDDNLLGEGIAKEKIVRVGNIMIDSLEMLRPKIEAENAVKKYGLKNGSYGLVTLHRPSNVDTRETLEPLCHSLKRIAQKIPLIFPVHPRTRKNLEACNLFDSLSKSEGIHLAEPIRYIEFMSLVFNSRLIITDSGGIQEETTYLGIPCLTLRPNTERPITITQGTNRLCTIENIEDIVKEILERKNSETKIPEFWDGKTADRVVKSILGLIN